MQVDHAVLQELLKFLQSHEVATLATAGEDKVVHASAIYYLVEEDLRFYFLTKDETVKYHNLVKDTNVALVITDPQILQSVQIEGIAREVDYVKEYATTVMKLTDKLAKSGRPWENLPINHAKNAGYYAFIQVTPKWIRWSDYKDWAHPLKFEQHF